MDAFKGVLLQLLVKLTLQLKSTVKLPISVRSEMLYTERLLMMQNNKAFKAFDLGLYRHIFCLLIKRLP